MPRLQAFELPFAYVEAGEQKQALVKVKVCDKCARKITYRPSEVEGATRSRHERDSNSERRRSQSRSNEDGQMRLPRESHRMGRQQQRRRSQSPHTKSKDNDGGS